MLKFLKWFFGLFSPYVSPFERKVDRFFRNVKSTDSALVIQKKLLELMQEDLIVVNVWLEKKFKGYKYLTKKVRRQMYEDVRVIVAKLDGHTRLNLVKKKDEKIKYLSEIMQFLKPGLYYKYIHTASFGKLLRNPNKAQLEGDCNQIVTLYIYLYSLKFPIQDLRIKLLPEHVCLHFNGTDIEATNATFQKYKNQKQILPVTEIISTNLLDLTDFREEVQRISPRTMVKSAQLAYAISSLRPLVVRNLHTAYRNLAVAAIEGNDFETAIFYLNKTPDSKMLCDVYRNAAIYYMDRADFDKARYYAGKLHDSEFSKTLKHNEGVYFYNKGRIDDALKVFTALGDSQMKKACYAAKYNELVKKVSGDRTLEAMKQHKSVYREMLRVAEKMGDSRIVASVRETLAKI